MDKEQVLLAQMQESWKDIRSYSSSIWQVTGLSLAAIGLVISQAVGGTYNGEPILVSFIGLFLLLFAVFISMIALSSINWLFSAVISRADMIHQMEGHFHNYDVELYSEKMGGISSKGVFGFGMLFIFEWRELPAMLGTLFVSLAGTATITMQYIGILIFPNYLEYTSFSVFCLLLILVLAYICYGSIKLRMQYMKKTQDREFKRIMQKHESES